MEKHVDRANCADVVIWVATLLAFCLLRKSNYVPISFKKFDKSRQLCHGDIAVGTECLLVNIKWSKTIQFAERNLCVPVIVIPNSSICPVRAFQQMKILVPASPDDPAFCIPGKSSIKPLTYRIFNAHLKQLVHQAGWVAASFSTHSQRGRKPRL